MISSQVVVRCEHGLHLRVASHIAKMAQAHNAKVRIRCEGCPEANACSVMELAALGAVTGTYLDVMADGPDEAVVLAKLTHYFEQGDGI